VSAEFLKHGRVSVKFSQSLAYVAQKNWLNLRVIYVIFLQYFDTVGSVTGRASGL